MKAAIVGHFAYGKTCLDGQTVKTHSIDKAIREIYGSDEVSTVDTHGIKKKILMLPFMLMRALKSAENVIILSVNFSKSIAISNALSEEAVSINLWIFCL